MTESRPSVTSIVLNYGTPKETIRALESLTKQTYDGYHRIVAIDNDSPDGSRELLEKSRPHNTELVVSPRNLGFGGGLNLILKDVATDYAFILNSDAWCPTDRVLGALTARIAQGTRIGAVSPRIVFDESWVRVVIQSDTYLPALKGDRDVRTLGMAVAAVDVDGAPVAFERLVFEAGFHDRDVQWGRPFRWSMGRSSILVPVPSREVGTITLHLMTHTRVDFLLETSRERRTGTLNPSSVDIAFAHHPERISVDYGEGDFVHRINNTGSHLKFAFHGSDRGFGSFDHGEFEEADPVFAFCGAAALLSVSALKDVGLFNEDYFLYYEDTELSWRMQRGGYEIWYEPAAVVRHGLSLSTGGESSDTFRFHVWRNRLYMLTTHAPARQAFRAVMGAIISLARQAIRPHRANARHFFVLRARVLGSYLRSLPKLIRQRP